MVMIKVKKLTGKASFVGFFLFFFFNLNPRMTGNHEQCGKVISSNVPEEKKMEK